MNQWYISIFCGLVLFFGIGCQPNSFDIEPANLTVKRVKLEETRSSKTLNIPSGSYTFENHNFDPNNPDTWTGDIAQYVDRYYFYSVSFTISNKGGIAYDTEVDLYFTHSDGSETISTMYVGQIDANQRVTETASAMSVNTELVGCDADVFWYD